MNIYSDKVSEKYRKYIIKVRVKSSKEYYFLWGTNLKNTDNDYLLVDRDNQILGFKTISDLLFFIKNSSSLLDLDNTKKWAKYYKRMRAYATYDLGKLENILESTKSIQSFNKKSIFLIIDFYNLFSDFTYQIGDKTMGKIINEKNTRKMIDYGYEHFFWGKNYIQSSKKNDTLNGFDYSQFSSNILLMVSEFVERIQMCTPTSDSFQSK